MAVRRSARGREEWEVYALATGSLPPRIHVAGRVLRVFSVGSISVIAAAPRTAPLPTEEALREQHAVVLALAERIDPILPARFGSRDTFPQLHATIRSSMSTLVDALAHVRGRQQMTLRLIGPAVVEEPPPPTATGTDYLRQRRAAARGPLEATPVRTAVAPFVVEERMQSGHGAVRATLFHLVARPDVGKYKEAVEDPNVAAAMLPWRITMTGPWPPFAFAPEVLT